MKKMNMVIAQSGGPSMVINQSLWGAVLAAETKVASKEIGKILGTKESTVLSWLSRGRTALKEMIGGFEDE